VCRSAQATVALLILTTGLAFGGATAAHAAPSLELLRLTTLSVTVGGSNSDRRQAEVELRELPNSPGGWGGPTG